eukprot:82494-Pelagomonas_calceolata.AAC.3
MQGRGNALHKWRGKAGGGSLGQARLPRKGRMRDTTTHLSDRLAARAKSSSLFIHGVASSGSSM